MSRGVLSLGRGFVHLFYRKKINGYCAFCKTPRSYLMKKHLYLHEILFLLGGSLVFGAALWEMFDPRAIIIFAFLLGSGEVFTFLRWRMSLICKHCGFDPVLYNVSPSKARERVKSFYEKKMNSPSFLLSKSPLLEVHKIRLEQERLKLKLRRVKKESHPPIPSDHLPPASS